MEEYKKRTEQLYDNVFYTATTIILLGFGLAAYNNTYSIKTNNDISHKVNNEAILVKETRVPKLSSEILKIRDNYKL